MPSQGICEFGFKPYPNNTDNVLNPCFLALIDSYITGLLLLVGIIQLIELFRNKKCPPVLQSQIFNLSKLSTKHLIHISAIELQVVLIVCLLFTSLSEGEYSPVVICSIILNLLFVAFISLPTQYFQYFKSICSIGNQLFYYSLHTLFFAFIVCQRYFQYPQNDYNVFNGHYSWLIELLLLFNSSNIFIYDLCFYTPPKEFSIYFKENNWYPTVNVFADCTYTWMNKMIMETYYNGKVKDPDNLPLPPVDLDIDGLSKKLEKHWELEKWNETDSLLRPIWKTFGRSIIIAILFETTKDILEIVEPQILRFFIQCFNKDIEKKYPSLHGFFIACSLFLTNVTSTILGNQFYITIFQAGLGIRGSLAVLIYQKSLRLSASSRSNFSHGDIMNFGSVDVLRLQRFFENAQSIIGAPIQIIAVLGSLYFLLGKATIGGVICMLVMMPINSYLSKKVKSLSKTQMKYKDMRIKLITEILSSMKSIKLYAWEKPMLEKLHHTRNELEIQNLKRIGIISNLIYFVWNCVPLLVTCSTFAIFTMISEVPLTPELIFPSLSLFNLLNNAIYTIPATINTTIETNISVNRLKKYLLSEELEKSFIERSNSPVSESDPVVEIRNATFLWKSKAEIQRESDSDEERSIGTSQVALNNINLIAERKALTCVVGKVGSGKTTLLRSILGELPCIEGNLRGVPPQMFINAETIAYCPQEPWIINESIKQNILFGHRYDENYYNLTVKACQLEADLDILPDADNTLVGEKGISLSGGQKARLSLARAVYARADIYLLDDILSAVDSGVRRGIIKSVLDNVTGLLKNKTVIMSTNTISVLKHAQHIYALENGTIVEDGTYDDILSRTEGSSNLKKLLVNFDSTTSPEMISSRSSDELKATPTADLDLSYEEDSDLTNEFGEERSIKATSRRASLITLEEYPNAQNNVDKGNNRLKEKIETGRVKASIYITYMKACGIFGTILFFTFLIMSRLFDLAETFWLKYWSESNQRYNSNKNSWRFIAIYAVIGIVSVAFNNLRTIILLIYSSIRASRKLHDTMADAVMRSPMQFFETTPVGRILNRFSADIDTIDSSLQNIFSVFFKSVLVYVMTILIVGISMPWFFVINIFLMMIYGYYQALYIVQSRDLKRLSSASLSPIMSLLSETLNGHSVINAYNHTKRFYSSNIHKVQYNIESIFTMRSTNRWLSIRLQTIGAAIVLITALLSLKTIGSDRQLSSGMVGLLMSYVLQITSSLTWIVRASVLIETSIVAVERVVEYCNLKPEEPNNIETIELPNPWPSRGELTFNNYSTGYKEGGELVLKNISLHIMAGEKIGIVGRTGAGKSTLSLALFRLLEAAEGSIVIDGIDIGSISLHDLRSHLAIIPQDAQAFEGTIRTNLDPFTQYEDEEVWNVIKISHLAPHLMRLIEVENDIPTPEQITKCLDVKVSENGSNLSIGQKQLLCLGRALLNKSKFLVLDEATAAVDMETDKIIQETIRHSFNDRTILTIAHRIDTILDNDKIIVLDKGEVKEFDTPQNLLANPDTIFYQLCDKGGYLKNN